ncbi:MAG: uroporphyrinogen decarboxylase [Gammaproteobacteria bacterium]|nr:uroporphyrinogen decarboxylase [Gammaproteobacteria bacterium]
MAELKNDRFLRALMREPVDVTPVWIMRQAGRYLPEYRKTRKKAGDFLTLCKTPELACEVTLQPLDRFDLDAAILFSDILTVPDAMGTPVEFREGEGPHITTPVRTQKDVDKLIIPDPEAELRYVMDAVRLIRSELNGRVPLIGFCGSPWTLATYMVEGHGSKDFVEPKRMLYENPKLMHCLLDKISDALILYLNGQIAAGAQTVMIFDTWGGCLTSHDYMEFSLRYMEKIIAGLNRTQGDQYIPIVLFTKGGGQWLEAMAESGADALGLDWTVDLADARARVHDTVALQGNMDPTLLYTNPERIREEVLSILSNYGQGPGHVFNLGHGIHPTIDPENVAALVNAVHELSPVFHK